MKNRWDEEKLWQILAWLRNVGGKVDRADRDRGFDLFNAIADHEAEVRFLASRLSDRLRKNRQSLVSGLEECANLSVHWVGLASEILEVLATDDSTNAHGPSGDSRHLDAAIGRCIQQGHTWIARFLASGPLAEVGHSRNTVRD